MEEDHPFLRGDKGQGIFPRKQPDLPFPGGSRQGRLSFPPWSLNPKSLQAASSELCFPSKREELAAGEAQTKLLLSLSELEAELALTQGLIS